jgi:hypothetical protein
MSRIPYARKYSDFSVTATNEKYAKISTITTASGTDVYENIGYFHAILSAGAGYTWSLPGTAVIVNRPKYESDWLAWAPTFTGFSADPTMIARYKVLQDRALTVFLDATAVGTSNATTFYATSPWTARAVTGAIWQAQMAYYDNSSWSTTTGKGRLLENTNQIEFYTNMTTGAWTASNNKSLRSFVLFLEI